MVPLPECCAGEVWVLLVGKSFIRRWMSAVLEFSCVLLGWLVVGLEKNDMRRELLKLSKCRSISWCAKRDGVQGLGANDSPFVRSCSIGRVSGCELKL